MRPEDLRIGMKANPRSAPIVDVTQFFQPALRYAARKALTIKLAVSGDLDLQIVRKRVHHGNADAVQAA
ncbi:hypothetical protein D3C72_2474530 [compost metagenome]